MQEYLANQRGVRPSLSLIGLDHDMRLTCLLSNSRETFWVAETFVLFSRMAGRTSATKVFFSRTLEKLGRTCDQIGRTLEPWQPVGVNASLKTFWNPTKKNGVRRILWRHISHEGFSMIYQSTLFIGSDYQKNIAPEILALEWDHIVHGNGECAWIIIRAG